MKKKKNGHRFDFMLKEKKINKKVHEKEYKKEKRRKNDKMK